MAMKDLVQKMKGFVGKATAPREQGQKPPMSTMPNGSVSGYQPRVVRPHAAQSGPVTHPAASFDRMNPAGVNPDSGPRFMPPLQPGQPQPVPVQQVQQPYGNQASSQPLPPPGQPMGTTSMPPMQQNAGQQPPMQGQSWPRQTVQQPAFQQPQAAPAMQHQNAPQQNPESNVRYFPGTVADEAGNPYAMVMRVAQVTGITSCYALLEFMQYDEAIIVNLDQITDVMEANRCIDMLFGAAYAMQHNFERIASRSVYLIAPQRVHVLPCENMMLMSQQDADRRWPGLSRMSAPASRQGRRDDFAPAFGQQAAAPRPGQYAEYGGFGAYR
ncbi:MAG: cell division protein SepF [Clostridia bacterium]|nr:cell division protein SepF [Clostridia bacterium]